MKLKDMSREQLEKKATKLGVSFDKETSDVKLRNRIRAAKKATVEEVGSDTWPKDWPKEMREQYYTQIVGQEMPGNETKAYRHLLKVIDERVPKMEATKVQTGQYDCFGIYYSKDFPYCNSTKGPGCALMPLCKATCKQRPELLKLATEIEEAQKEDSKVTDKEAEEALQASSGKKARKAKEKEDKAEKATTKEAKVTSSKPGGQDSKRYCFRGIWEEYKKALKGDKDSLTVYKWIDKPEHHSKGFTRSDLVAYLAPDYDDAEEYANEIIQALLDEKDVVVK